MPKFRVQHPRTGQDVWWRAFESSGQGFDCGLSSIDMNSPQRIYETQNTVFAWMPYDGSETQFSPHEILPIPSLSTDNDEELVTFAFDGNGNCSPSHGTVYIVNTDGSFSNTVALEQDTVAVEDAVEVPANVRKEIVFPCGDQHLDCLRLRITWNRIISGEERSDIFEVANGDTVTIGSQFTVRRTEFWCPIPVFGIPIRCINLCGEDAVFTVYFSSGLSHWQMIGARQDPTIVWLSDHPTRVEWSTPSASASEPYEPGMTVTIRSPAAAKARAFLFRTDRTSGVEDLCELLEGAGELEACAGLFVKNRIEYAQLFQLSPTDWRDLGLPVGSRLRILDRVRGIKRNTERGENEYDVFLSHKHTTGEDLAHAIKLQLQVMFPQKHLRVFLDVDNLKDKRMLRDHVVRSRNFVLLLTPGVFESPSCRMESAIALESQMNVLVVHDVKNCSFPRPSSLPEEIRPILDKIAIPYYRNKSMREAAMLEIAKGLHLDN